MLDNIQYSHTILIFAVSAVCIELLVGYCRLKSRLKVLMLLALFGLVVTPIGESIALQVGIWSYTPGKFSGLYLAGAALETYGFSFFVVMAVACATIIWSDDEDSGGALTKMTVLRLRAFFMRYYR